MERFTLQSAILHECQNKLGGAIWEEAKMPDTRPWVYLKIKMATINGKTRYILTISGENRGLHGVDQLRQS